MKKIKAMLTKAIEAYKEKKRLKENERAIREREWAIKDLERAKEILKEYQIKHNLTERSEQQ